MPASKKLWIVFTNIAVLLMALLGFITFFNLLMPKDIPFSDIPISAKLNTALGVGGFFLAASGIGGFAAAVIGYVKCRLRQSEPTYTLMWISVLMVLGGVFMLRHYWLWLESVST